MIPTDSVDYLIALWVEPDGAHGLPVARVSTPARRVALAGALVDLMPGRQDRVIAAFMPRGRADIADAAVQMLMVVPMHELRRPVARGLHVCKAARRELGAVLGSAQQRFDKGVVIAHVRTRVRRLDAEPVQHGQHRWP